MATRFLIFVQCVVIYPNVLHFVVLIHRNCSKGPRTYPKNSTSIRTVTVEVTYPKNQTRVKVEDGELMVFALAEREGVVLAPGFTYEHLKEVPDRRLG